MQIVLVILVLIGAAVLWLFTLGPYRAVPDDAIAPLPKVAALGATHTLEEWSARRLDGGLDDNLKHQRFTTRRGTQASLLAYFRSIAHVRLDLMLYEHFWI